MKEALNIVWLKRDLRLQDHLPFFEAENNSTCNYLPIYIMEPSAMAYPDSSLRHLQFVYHSILDMNSVLSAFNRKVHLLHGEAQDIFTFLGESFDIQNVYSYQESGVKATWDRDKNISALFKLKGIKWTEFQRDGIIRGIKNRVNWDKNWFAAVNSPLVLNGYTQNESKTASFPFDLPSLLLKSLEKYNEELQKPGESYAVRYMRSFCEGRGANYSRHISKPKESRKSCGRISPYLAWGNLSVRQAVQFVRNHPNYDFNKRSFNNHLTRLKWRCHFIQKFDTHRNGLNKGYHMKTIERKKLLLSIIHQRFHPKFNIQKFKQNLLTPPPPTLSNPNFYVV